MTKDNVNENNILKDKDLFTESDYEKMMIARQYDKLYEMSNKENIKQCPHFGVHKH